jgi:hypothetical protein
LPERRPMSRREAREARMKARGETPPYFDTTRRKHRRRSLRRKKLSLRRLRPFLAGIFLVAAVALIGSYTFLPPLVEALFGRGVQGQLGLESSPEVELESEPPPRILAGEFSEGRVALDNAEFGEIRPDSVTIDLDPFELDLLDSARSGELRTQKPLSGTIRATISEEEVGRVARENVDDVPISGVELEENAVIVRAGAEVLEVDVPISVKGELHLRGESLVFEPRSVSAFGVRIPDKISERLLSGTDFEYPIDDMPYGAEISTVEIREDELILSGTLDHLPVGG